MDFIQKIIIQAVHKQVQQVPQPNSKGLVQKNNVPKQVKNSSKLKKTL